MKKLYYVVLMSFLFIFNSCSLDDGDQVTYEVLPFETVALPQNFVLGETYEIEFTYLRPTTCHGYNGVLLRANDSTRTIAVSTFLVSNTGCEDLVDPDNIASNSFNFKVLYDQTYIFEIWKGKDSEGNDIYETVEVPVTD